jgi:hypothetical protein
MEPRNPQPPSGIYCLHATYPFVPHEFLERWAKGEIGAPKDTDFRGAIQKAFHLDPREGDGYIYYATAKVTLNQVQHGIEYGGAHDLHGWYRDEEEKIVS